MLEYIVRHGINSSLRMQAKFDWTTHDDLAQARGRTILPEQNTQQAGRDRIIMGKGFSNKRDVHARDCMVKSV